MYLQKNNQKRMSKKYSREEVFNKTLEYFKGDELATNVWINKYALKDSDGNIYELSPEDMHHRLAKEIYRIEKNYPNPLSEEEIFEVLKNFKYIVPQGGPMSGIGNDRQVVSLSNCFVIGNEYDSYGSIMLTDQEQVQLMKRRGGVGHDLSHLRPNLSPVKNSALTSTGLVSFMERYSNSTREVGQDGRRGALMLSCSIKNVDSERFMDAKMTEGKVTGANVSLKITDDFMKAVIDDTTYQQQFPIDSANPFIKKEVKAKPIFNKIIHNAWKSAEPGILFWDTIIRESVPDCYEKFGYKSTSTNPCVVGDTLVAVADGRNAVSIKQLADEGKDVPVYTIDNENNLTIRTMRNPRITGYNQKIYKVTIEGGISYRVTGNHKFILKNGTEIEAKNLKNGDSLFIMTKYQNNYKSNKYYHLRAGNTHIGDHRLIAEFYNNLKLNDLVVHHKDYNGLNNNPDNLQIMTKEEHDNFHKKDMIGNLNPYHKMSKDWKFNFASHPGETNPNYTNISNDDLLEHARKLTISLNRRFSKSDWINYAKENNLPQYFSNFRLNDIGNIIALSKRIALELGYDKIDCDPRLVKTYTEALNNGYNAEIIDDEVLVTKTCEHCGTDFKINYFKREISFCSHECSLKYINSDKEINEKRTNTINEIYSKKADETKQKQIEILSKLKFKLGKMPLAKEWQQQCKENNVPFRLKTKHGFQNYKEICEEVEYYNHKVISVEEDGFENVYNGTVDDFHKFFITDNDLKINTLTKNCGEIPLCPYDSCRLLAINLLSYVENPFLENAYFNFDLFKKHSKYAQRIMDDIIDLELEKIEQILEKIESDPEPEHIKAVEKNLWIKIGEKAKEGRRTGIGITAEGDMIAALGLRYGTKKATEMSIKIHKELALNVYHSSCDTAIERGSFGVFDYELEKNNPFIKRLIEADPELGEKMKIGRRNIALLTIAPTGCLVKDTKIKTDNGIITLENLFLLNNIDIKLLEQEKDIWFDLEKEIYVFDVNGNKNKIIKLYWNGYDKTKILSYTDGTKIESTNKHKWLVKISDNKAVWKRTDELKKGDKIIKTI
jgi:ribonucleotide reductase alpha subunit